MKSPDVRLERLQRRGQREGKVTGDEKLGVSNGEDNAIVSRGLLRRLLTGRSISTDRSEKCVRTEKVGSQPLGHPQK